MIARVDRRQLLKAAAASAAAAAFPAPALAQSGGPRVVIIGGGFGGASCARALRKTNPRIAVTLIEANPVYTASPMSNAVIAGLIDLKHQQFHDIDCLLLKVDSRPLHPADDVPATVLPSM